MGVATGTGVAEGGGVAADTGVDEGKGVELGEGVIPTAGVAAGIGVEEAELVAGTVEESVCGEKGWQAVVSRIVAVLVAKSFAFIPHPRIMTCSLNPDYVL